MQMKNESFANDNAELLQLVCGDIKKHDSGLLYLMIDHLSPERLAEMAAMIDEEHTRGLTLLHFIYNCQYPDEGGVKTIDFADNVISKLLRKLMSYGIDFRPIVSIAGRQSGLMENNLLNKWFLERKNRNPMYENVEQTRMAHCFGQMTYKFRENEWVVKKKEENCSKYPYLDAILNGSDFDSVILPLRKTLTDEELYKQDSIAIFYAARTCHVEALERLFALHGPGYLRWVLLNRFSASGSTPLFHACLSGNVKAVRLLYDAFPAALTSANKGKALPIWGAAFHGHVEIVKFLVEKMVEQGHQILISEPDEFNESPLYVAAKNGYTEVVDILLRHTPSESLKLCSTVKKRTPMLAAFFNGYLKTGLFMFNKLSHDEKLAALTEVDSDGRTLFSAVASIGSVPTLKMFYNLSHDVIYTVNKWGGDALWFAANGGHLEAVEWLCSTNREFGEESKSYALDTANEYQYIDVIRFLSMNVRKL